MDYISSVRCLMFSHLFPVMKLSNKRVQTKGQKSEVVLENLLIFFSYTLNLIMCMHSMLQVFLVYLYATSLGILFYFLLCLLHGIKVKNNFYENNFRVSIRNDGSINKSPTASPLPVRASTDDKTPLDQQKKDSNAEQISLTAISYQSNLELPAPGGVAHVGEGINFYLRLGALGNSDSKTVNTGCATKFSLVISILILVVFLCFQPLLLAVLL